MAPLRTLGRLGRRGLAAGAVTGRAAGNSVVTSDVRGQPAGRPGNTDGINTSPVGGVGIITPPSQLGEETYARPFQWGRLIARDRHVIARQGRTTSGAEPSTSGGTPNPEQDGAPRPAWEMINRTESFQVGTDATANLDNTAMHASTTAGGRRFPLGNQGSTPWERVDGGTPGLYRPYGARGFVIGPAPSVYALPGDGSGARAGVLLAQGAPEDGPQSVFGGYPHGLHSETVAPLKVSRGRIRAVPQQVAGRAQRPSNSKIAGQSYSQTVVHQSGAGGGPLPSMPSGRKPGPERFQKR